MTDPLRILVLDDDDGVVRLVERVLTRAGHSVKTFTVAREAVAFAAQGPLDLLIVDKNIPQMSGVQVIRACRELQPGLPVVMMTGHPEPLSGTPDRIDAYLAKPFKSLATLEQAAKDAVEVGRNAQKREQMRRQLDQVMASLRPAIG